MAKENAATVEQVSVQVENGAENASNEMVNVGYQTALRN